MLVALQSTLENDGTLIRGLLVECGAEDGGEEDVYCMYVVCLLQYVLIWPGYDRSSCPDRITRTSPHGSGWWVVL